MAASLNLTSAALAPDGVTFTATVSGASGAISPLSGVTGLAVKLNSYAVALASVTISGTTLTAKLLQPANPTVALKFDLSSGSNLADASANTATGQTAVAVANNSTQRLRQVGVKTPWNSQGVSNGTDTACNSRVPQVIPNACSGLRVAFANSYGSENSGPNAFTLTAALEYSGVSYPVTWNGASSVVVQPGAIVFCDPVAGLSPTAASTVYVRSHVTVASGGVWPRGFCFSDVGCGYEHGASGASQTDKTTATGNLTTDAFEFGFGPVALIGTPTSTTTVAFGGYGDSILYGQGSGVNLGTAAGSNLGGFWNSALGYNYAHANLAMPGETLSTISGTSGAMRRSLGQYFTHSFIEYGTNDFGSSSALATVQAAALATATALKAGGVNSVVTMTVVPRTTSTDSWATTANQTPVGSSGTARPNYNDWIRAGAPIDPTTKAAVAVGTSGALLANTTGHPFSAYLEVADTAESSRNSNKWYVTGVANEPTFDGVHPAIAGHARMQAAIVFPAPAITPTATPSTVTGNSTAISANRSGGTAPFSFVATTTAKPSGSAPVIGLIDATTGNFTVTYDRSGTYTHSLTVTDSFFTTATATVTVTVSQTLTTMTVTPGAPTVEKDATQQFAAATFDQFGQTFATNTATFTRTGAGSITTGGLYTASAVGSATITATQSGVTGTATVTVVDTTPPSIPTLTAYPGDRHVYLTWDASTGTPAGYKIYRNGVFLVSRTLTYHTDAGLTNDTPYSFTITSYDAAGNESAQSPAIIAIPRGPAVVTLPTYLTVESADALAADLSGLTAWAAASGDDKRRALISATSRVDKSHRWQGRKFDPDQALEFPRVDGDIVRPSFILPASSNLYGVQFIDRDPMTGEAVVPLGIKLGTIFEADSILAGQRDDRVNQQHDGLIAQSIGKASETYALRTGTVTVQALCFQAEQSVAPYRLRSGRLQ